MIFETVVNHQQGAEMAGGPHAGMVRFTGYLYVTPAEAQDLDQELGRWALIPAPERDDSDVTDAQWDVMTPEQRRAWLDT